MKIVEPYAQILNPMEFGKTSQELGQHYIKIIEFAARISHRSEEDAGGDTLGFLQRVVMDRADWSVTEHVSITVDAVMDRGCTHEWVRHRLAGYTQESTRFVNYQKKMPPAFIYPQVEGERAAHCEHCLAGNEPTYKSFDVLSRWCHRDGSTHVVCAYDGDWLAAMHNAETMYKSLLNRGWRPQEARSVFPNALAARIVTTANLRSWRHFFLMRTSKQAQPQIRLLATDLLRRFQAMIPVLYDDIEPGQTQKYNAGLGR